MNILVTGGTGFFGRAFCRYVESVSKRVVVYSRDEAKQAEMRDHQNGDRMRWMIGDVRDLKRLTRAMRGIDVVVHAAALKRIEVGQYNPDEMVKTNVIGTMNVIDAAITNNVQKVVFLSSDKAFQPISPYGQSKALAESLILQANNITGKDATRFAAVRYGNVAFSTGSVIPRWRRMLQTNIAVPVTDPDATRFWMTLGHAVDIVYDTIVSMSGGELNIPDLPAYRVGDLAVAMGAVPIVTGLPAHEKLHESMDDARCSANARRMTVDELKFALTQL